MSSMAPDALRRMYRNIALTKAYNSRFVELKRQGKVPGPIHQTEGQEAVGVGVCAALTEKDQVVNYYRGFAEWVSRGVNLKSLAAEILGKGGGLCGGKGGEMTLADPASGIVSTSGIVGGSIPTGVGVAYAAKMRRQGQVVAVFFGDGAANTGAFHEGLNMAAALKVPALFVCLNNQYAISTCIDDVMAGPGIAGRAAAYGIPGVEADGNDVIAMYGAAAEAVTRARAGGGPTLIEGKTFRMGGHSSTNPEADFMDQEKLAYYQSRDPLVLLGAYMLDQRAATPAELHAIEQETAKEAEEAIAFGLAAPPPPAATATEGVFV